MKDGLSRSALGCSEQPENATPLGIAQKTRDLTEILPLSDEEKIAGITKHFSAIMQILGLDLNDDNLHGTPRRVAKMYVNEIFSGLDEYNKPDATLFENKYQYNGMLLEKNITFHSVCAHHFMPFYGKVHLAYYPNNAVIGLSKINRLVQYYASRPQVQELLTIQIADGMKDILKTQHVAVMIEAVHLCVAARGIKDTQSATATSLYSGKFLKEEHKCEFLNQVKA